MPADFPAFAMGGYKRKPYIRLSENKQETIELEDGRKIQITIENPATVQPAKAPLTEDQKRNQYFLAAVIFLVILAICMIFTLFATI
jgi:hypothetical protein